MKCIIAFTILVVAIAHAAVLPLGYPAIPHTYIESAPLVPTHLVSAPLIRSAPFIHASPYIHTPLSYTARTAPLAYAAAPIAAPLPPITIAHAAPITPIVHTAPVIHTAPIVPIVQTEGNYVAANRGAVHVAPLPGHSLSASSVNLEPAPGTL